MLVQLIVPSECLLRVARSGSGIIVVKMAELLPSSLRPIGLNCFVVAGVRPDISVQQVFKGAAPFFIADAMTIAGLIAFPQDRALST